MLHPELESFVRLSKEILPKSQSEIFTNGVYLNPERYETLRNAGVDRFTVTKHKGLTKIAFEETYNNLSPEEKARNQFFDYSKLVYTNRGNLVDYGKNSINLQKNVPDPHLRPGCHRQWKRGHLLRGLPGKNRHGQRLSGTYQRHLDQA